MNTKYLFYWLLCLAFTPTLQGRPQHHNQPRLKQREVPKENLEDYNHLICNIVFVAVVATDTFKDVEGQKVQIGAINNDVRWAEVGDEIPPLRRGDLVCAFLEEKVIKVIIHRNSDGTESPQVFTSATITVTKRVPDNEKLATVTLTRWPFETIWTTQLKK